MSIWIGNKLAPYSHKKTLLVKREANYEKLLIWLEGVDKKFNFPSNGFGICGGSIGTNAGFYFTKDQVQEILDSMPDGAQLRIAACNHIGDVEKTFAKDNDMIQTGNNSFAPSDHPEIENLIAKYNGKS